MTPDDIAKFYPHLSPENRQVAAELYSAAEPLRAALEKMQTRDDLRVTLLQQWGGLLNSAMNLIGAK